MVRPNARVAQFGAERVEPVLRPVDEDDPAPAARQRRAQARPMPEAAPVIATTLPARDWSMRVSCVGSAGVQAAR